MKSTYKILTPHLDNLPKPVAQPVVYSCNSAREIQDICVPYKLFDVERYERKVFASKLLKSKSIEAIYSMFIDVYIPLDCFILIDNEIGLSPIVDKLYVLRVIQLYNLLCERFPEIRFTLVIDDKQLKKVNKIIYRIYNTSQ